MRALTKLLLLKRAPVDLLTKTTEFCHENARLYQTLALHSTPLRRFSRKQENFVIKTDAFTKLLLLTRAPMAPLTFTRKFGRAVYGNLAF